MANKPDDSFLHFALSGVALIMMKALITLILTWQVFRPRRFVRISRLGMQVQFSRAYQHIEQASF